jgi:beta-lactamase regulating signal transducer with metallopeptidase domain
MTSAFISSMAELFAQRLALCLMGGAALCAAVWMLLRFTHFSSRTRYLIWWTTLLSSIFLLVPQAAVRSTSAVGSATALLTLPSDWAIYAFGFWVLGVTIGITRIVAGAVRVHQLRKSCRPITPTERGDELAVALRVGEARKVVLCTSDSITMPSVLGFFRPVIVIPSHLWKELAPAELRQVVIHEMAHLKFWDDWAILGQKLLRSLLFFHPAAWLVDRQLTVEREMVCDDFVVQQTGDSKAYARCLASLAELAFVRRTAALVNAVLGRPGQTVTRVGRLLQQTTPTSNRVLRPAISVAAVVLMAAFSIRAYTPTLIGFRAEPEQTAKVIDSGMDNPVAAVPVIYRPKPVKSNKVRATVSPRESRKAEVSEAGVLKASTRTGELKPKILQAKATNQPGTLTVQRAYFAVVTSDVDGMNSVSVYQLTVWQAAPPAVKVNHKTT